MIRHIPLALALLGSLAVPALAAGPAPDETPKDGTQANPATPLPPTMRRHGVIGHIVLPESIDLLETGILAQMRDRLVIQAQDDKK